MKPLIAIDVNFLCYRAFFTTGVLSYHNDPTGTLYGFLRDVRNFSERFQSNDMVFCFDSKHSLRAELLPSYKSSRREKVLTDDERTALEGFRAQVVRLRKEILPALGFRNVLQYKGFEADDLLAQTVKAVPGREVIMISGDHDLYQCLGPNVLIHSPAQGENWDRVKFEAVWGCDPKTWVYVKALAGCKTDDIPGVRGVAEATAIKYFNGQITTGAKYQEITKFISSQNYSRNLQLVKLPFEGCPEVELEEQDPIDDKVWDSVLSKLGIKSLSPKVDNRPKIGLFNKV